MHVPPEQLMYDDCEHYTRGWPHYRTLKKVELFGPFISLEMRGIPTRLRVSPIHVSTRSKLRDYMEHLAQGPRAYWADQLPAPVTSRPTSRHTLIRQLGPTSHSLGGIERSVASSLGRVQTISSAQRKVCLAARIHPGTPCTTHMGLSPHEMRYLKRGDCQLSFPGGLTPSRRSTHLPARCYCFTAISRARELGTPCSE